MQRWAYAIVRNKAGRWVVEGDAVRGDRYQADVFAEMGMNGWEMVAVDDSGAFHFKRPTRANGAGATEDEAAPTTRNGSGRRNDPGTRRQSSDVA
jgi:hypothetical protein